MQRSCNNRTMLKKILNQLNIIGQCKQYGLSIWQCPQFLFVIMGLIIIIASIVSFLIGNRYVTDPYLVSLMVISITAVLFVISFIITRSFERLAEASRMKSEFISVVSHQLRSPITNIKWIVDFLTSDDVTMSPEKKDDYFSHLRDNTARMVELVDELLIVARIEQGGFPVRKKLGSLDNLIKEVIRRSKVFAEASNVSFRFYSQKDLPKVNFDPTLMRMVIENLVDNAIRYTKGKGKIELHLMRKGSSLHFSIKDDGVGIPKTDQGHIFKKFFRSENALKEQTQGSGLGLYIVKSIITTSKGRRRFNSIEGKGTTFYFTLPI